MKGRREKYFQEYRTSFTTSKTVNSIVLTALSNAPYELIFDSQLD